MKSFKDYLSNALDDLTFWNDSNTRQAVTNQYVKDTILRNVPVKVTLRDQEDKIVDERDVKCSFQYLFNPMRNCKCAFYVPIGTDKVIGTSAKQSFLVLTTFDVNNAARESEIWDNFKRATYGCKASIDGGDLVLKFTKPVRLVGVDQPVTVELVIDKRVGSWRQFIIGLSPFCLSWSLFLYAYYMSWPCFIDHTRYLQNQLITVDCLKRFVVYYYQSFHTVYINERYYQRIHQSCYQQSRQSRVYSVERTVFR